MNLFNNPDVSTAMATDSYKFSHYGLYPEDATEIMAYLESRGGEHDHVVFATLQIALIQFLSRPLTKKQVRYAEKRVLAHGLPFNRAGFDYIVNKLGGKWPVEIRAVAEGSVVPTHNVLMTIKNTGGKETVWVTNFLETLLLKVWYGTTVATKAYYSRKVIREFLLATADDLSGLLFKLHNFGDRGSTWVDSAAIGGLAHLMIFMGTDNFLSLEVAKEYYGCEMAGFSLPATEHSNMTILGRDGEYTQLEKWLDLHHDKPMVACVIDSYDPMKFIEAAAKLKHKIYPNGPILVFRPDSGIPWKMVVKVLKKLDKHFGSVLNSRGYKVLNGVRVIYGDGIDNENVIRRILTAVMKNKFSTDNVGFGQGAGLMQKCDRDTQKFATKVCAAIINGKVVEVYKDPITDPGKRSKRGYQNLILNAQKVYETINEDPATAKSSELRLVYKDGMILVNDTLDQIRERVNNGEIARAGG